MPELIQLHDLADPRLDCYLRLTELQLRNRLEPEKGIFIAESRKVIERALAAGLEPLSFLMPEGKVAPHWDLVEAAEAPGRFGRNELPVFSAPDALIEQLTGYELTRGILAAFRRPVLPSVADLVEGARVVAVLEDITNHTNIGALFRSAAALGVDAVLLTPGCCDPLYRRAVRVSMGTVFQVPWTRIGTQTGSWPVDALAELHGLGFATCALALKDDAVSLDDPVLREHEKVAALFGTEGEGLADATIAECDHTVIIPMKHGVDSLNVAAASAVTFWELRR